MLIDLTALRQLRLWRRRIVGRLIGQRVAVFVDQRLKTHLVVGGIFGAVVGGILGMAIALWIETTANSAVLGLVLGAAIFGFCSVRWGDSAWDILSRLTRM